MSKLSTMAKIRTAFARRNLPATAIGALKGGAIPFGTFALYHLEMGNDIWQPKGLIVLGGLIYSAKTVFGWCKQVFRRDDGSPDSLKALGWCVGIEGFMTCSSTFWLNCAALALLIAVNAVATGVSLAMEDEESQAREAAAAAEVPEATRGVDAEIAALRGEIAALAALAAPRAAAAEVQPANVEAAAEAKKQARPALKARKATAKRAKRSAGAASMGASTVN